MNILEQLVRVFAPHTCLGCGAEEDRLICEGCLSGLPPVPSRCYRCKAVTDEYQVCAGCAGKTPLRQVIAGTYYQDLAKELVHRTKYERAQAGMHEIAGFLAPLLADLPPDAVLCHVPTATGRVRARGYDHARILARAVARRTTLSCYTLLARRGQAHQVGASRAERLRQLQDAFRAVRPDAIRGKHVVLVDDVLTTGATLETAARVLRRAGARRVSAVVFAQA